MTDLLQKAFEEASTLPDSEQDRLAQWLIAEIESENRWDQAFAESQDALAKLAENALQEHREGRTQPLDAEQL